jgi:Family of unknown function (DUF5677)
MNEIEKLHKSYQSNWKKYIALRSSKLENLNYSNETEKYIFIIFARVNALCDEIITLANQNKTTSAQIIMRSQLESFIDIRCLIDDPNYIQTMYQDELEQDIKFYKNNTEKHLYNKGLFNLELRNKELIALKAKRNKKQKLDIQGKFIKSGFKDLNYTLYNNLCRHSHGNITALASKSFDNGKIIFSKSSSKIELNFLYSTSINTAIASALDIMDYFKFNDNHKIEFEKLLKKNKEIALYFIE